MHTSRMVLVIVIIACILGAWPGFMSTDVVESLKNHALNLSLICGGVFGQLVLVPLLQRKR